MLDRNQILSLDDKGLLAKIAEEASEVIKAAMKQHAHGPRPHFVVQYDNVRDLHEENAQLQMLMKEHYRRFYESNSFL